MAKIEDCPGFETFGADVKAARKAKQLSRSALAAATSMHSRNNRAGILIGKGETPENAVKEVGMVVEGMNALPAALELAERYQVEMPIVQTVNAIVNKGMSAAEAVKSLMERGLKNELPQGYEK